MCRKVKKRKTKYDSIKANNQLINSQKAMGPSIPLIRRLYSNNCIEFDHIWAWEAIKMPSWYDRVPPADRPKITFFNEPVNTSDSSAFGVLRATARREDFVVVKLDIDTPAVENELVRRLVGDPTLAALVDEFFFEVHLADNIASDGAMVASGLQALRLMSDLRHMGVRAHFWV